VGVQMNCPRLLRVTWKPEYVAAWLAIRPTGAQLHHVFVPVLFGVSNINAGGYPRFVLIARGWLGSTLGDFGRCPSAPW
jgi:hypothetical protein